MGVVTEQSRILDMFVGVMVLVLVVVLVVLSVVHLPQDASHILLHRVLDLRQSEVVASELEASLLLWRPVDGEMFLQVGLCWEERVADLAPEVSCPVAGHHGGRGP